MATEVPVPEIKQVIVMRTDLGMRRGKQIAQGAHASAQFLVDTVARDVIVLTNTERAWLAGDRTKICVGVGSEEELLEIRCKAQEASLRVDLIQDLGKTEFHGVPTFTCLAIGPDLAERIDPITGHLKLL